MSPRISAASADDRRARRRLLMMGAIAGVALTLLSASIAVLCVIGFGWFSAAAIVPHSRLVGWATRTTMIHAMRNGAAAVRPPRQFGGEAQILRGFRAYDAHCVVCHGAPGIARANWVRGMTPTPPYLLDAASRWSPTELKFVVSNGVKMTAMPAWRVTLSDSEIWDIVAFLERLPDTTPARYARLRGQKRSRTAPAGWRAH